MLRGFVLLFLFRTSIAASIAENYNGTIFGGGIVVFEGEGLVNITEFRIQACYHLDCDNNTMSENTTVMILQAMKEQLCEGATFQEGTESENCSIVPKRYVNPRRQHLCNALECKNVSEKTGVNGTLVITDLETLINKVCRTLKEFEIDDLTPLWLVAPFMLVLVLLIVISTYCELNIQPQDTCVCFDEAPREEEVVEPDELQLYFKVFVNIRDFYLRVQDIFRRTIFT